MVNFQMIFVLLFLLSANANIKIETLYSELALDYFKSRDVQSVIMFLCWKIQDRYNILRLFNDNGISVSLPNSKQHLEVKNIKEMFIFQGKYLGAVFDSVCYDSGVPYYQKYIFFNASYPWLIFDNQKLEDALLYAQTLPLSIVTDMTITKTNFYNGSYTIELYDVYNPGYDRGGSLNVTSMGEWSPENKNENQKWKNFVNELKVSRRSNLNGLSIRAVTFSDNRAKDEPLESYLVDEHFPYIDSVFKLNYQLVLLLREMYNFTIILVLADNWTDKNANGFYRSGNLMGVLGDRKADIMAGALQLMPDRLDITDVLHMTYPFRSGFIFLYSGNFGSIQLSFLTPFVDIVWCIMVMLAITTVITICFIFVFENKYLPQENNIKWSISDTILSVLTAWCQMGSPVQPLTYASRLVYITMFVTSLILYNFYTSSIVSSLLSYRSQKFSIIDLADSPMQCGSFDTGYVHNLLFDIPLYPNMAYFNSKKKTKNFYYTIDEGLSRVQKGEFAFHAEFSSLYNFIENSFEATQICELQEVETIPLIQLAILSMKNLPYSEMFKVGLVKARETGQLNRLLLKWNSRKPICQASKGVSEVNIHQIASLFFVLICGHLIAIVVYFYECNKRKRAQKLNVSKLFNIKHLNKKKLHYSN